MTELTDTKLHELENLLAIPDLDPDTPRVVFGPDVLRELIGSLRQAREDAQRSEKAMRAALHFIFQYDNGDTEGWSHVIKLLKSALHE